MTEKRTKIIPKDGKPTEVVVVTRYAVTVQDGEDRRIIDRNRAHETRAQAEQEILDLRTANSPANLARFWPEHETFDVRPVECYENGYCLGIIE